MLRLLSTVRQASRFKKTSVADLQPAPLHEALVSLKSPEGKRLRNEGTVNERCRSLHKPLTVTSDCYGRLLATFFPQSHGAFCVLTTTAIAVRHCGTDQQATIGELETLAPLRKAIPEGWFASLGFPFLDTVGLPHSVLWRLSEHIVYAGLSSQSMELLLACHGLQGRRQLATSPDDREGLAVFREAVQGAASEGSGQCLVVNYHRGTVHQIPVNNGHMSPVAGYHRDSDKCLVLDTNTWRYPPVWIDTELLWAAMCRRTNIGVPRGYLVVEK